MEHSETCDHTQCAHTNASVCQTISEMDWERGLWYAGTILTASVAQLHEDGTAVTEFQSLGRIKCLFDPQMFVSEFGCFLCIKSFYGDEKRVIDLINKARNARELVNSPDNAGYTPLHYAARKGFVDICKILLHNGAQINAQTKSGQATPLHKAAAAGKIDTIAFLIQSGARINLKDADGQTILHKAAENKHPDLVKYLLERYHELAAVEDIKGSCVKDYVYN